MEIRLILYERRSLENLERQFGLERELIVGFADDLQSIAHLFEQTVSHHAAEFRAGRVVVIGLINHAHALLNGGLNGVETGNAAVWSSCFRGLIEVFGACALLEQKPNTAPNYLGHVEAGKLYNAAKTAHPEFADDLKRLHQIVHPGSGAIYSGATPVDEIARKAIFAFGLRPLDTADGREAVIVLANLAHQIVTQFRKLVSNLEVLSAGQIVMERVANPSP